MKKYFFLYEGIFFALGAALLFGFAPVLCKPLLQKLTPVALAGFLYLGTGIGLGIYYFLRHFLRKKVIPSDPCGSRGTRNLFPIFNWSRKQRWTLLGIIFFGGILAPLSLCFALNTGLAFEVSLALNFELIFTALFARLVFKEHIHEKVMIGMGLIFLSGIFLAWPHEESFTLTNAMFLTLLASLFWAVDNNLSRGLSDQDPIFIALAKGVVAGGTNLILASQIGGIEGSLLTISMSLIVGFLTYGLSVVLLILALRHLGTSRAIAFFGMAPFIGALASIIFLGESVTQTHIVIFFVMFFAILLMVTERHSHEHTHEELFHEHWHFHDEHHKHSHEGWEGNEPHIHPHRHEPIMHTHPHWPDIHHRHLHQ